MTLLNDKIDKIKDIMGNNSVRYPINAVISYLLEHKYSFIGLIDAEVFTFIVDYYSIEGLNNE